MLLETFLEPLSELSKLVRGLSMLPLHISVLLTLLLSFNARCCLAPLEIKEQISCLRDLISDLSHFIIDCFALGILGLCTQRALTHLAAIHQHFRIQLSDAGRHLLEGLLEVLPEDLQGLLRLLDSTRAS